MQEHMVAIVSFEGAIKREIKRVREYLKQDENMTEFKLSIKASGRVLDGEVKLTYQLQDGEYGDVIVKGNSLQPLLDELLRRRGFDKIHAPTAIAYNKVVGDDEVPF